MRGINVVVIQQMVAGIFSSWCEYFEIPLLYVPEPELHLCAVRLNIEMQTADKVILQRSTGKEN